MQRSGRDGVEKLGPGAYNSLPQGFKTEGDMERLGFCIIGCGGIAHLHAEGASSCEGVDLYGCDIDIKRAEELMGEFGGKGVFRDYEEVLRREEIRIVDICLPHHLHREVAVAALEAGKHVLLEKPIASTLKEADDIIEAARRAKERFGTKFMVAECWRFYPPAVKAAQLIEEGVLGEPFLVQANTFAYYVPSGWRRKLDEMGGGAFLDRGIHFVHMTIWLGGGDVEAVFARTTHRTVREMEGEDSGFAMIDFKSGVVGQVNVSWGTISPPRLPNIAVYGSEGTAYDLDGLYLAVKGREPVKVEESRLEPWMIPEEVRHFIGCVRTGAEPAVTGEMARLDLEVVLAAYESARTGERVTLPL